MEKNFVIVVFILALIVTGIYFAYNAIFPYAETLEPYIENVKEIYRL